MTSWEKIMAWHGGVATSVREEAAPGKEKGGDDTSWTDTNFIRLKNKKIHTIDSVVINEW
jgi:hypothetical protein